MPDKKEQIKALMISLLEQDGVETTILNDEGTHLTIRFNPGVVSIDDLYDTADPLHALGIQFTFLEKTL